jgi:hypothetical protein
MTMLLKMLVTDTASPFEIERLILPATAWRGPDHQVAALFAHV